MIMSFLLPCVMHAVRVDLFRRYMMQTGVLTVSGRMRDGHRRDDLHMSSARILKGNVSWLCRQSLAVRARITITQ